MPPNIGAMEVRLKRNEDIYKIKLKKEVIQLIFKLNNYILVRLNYY